MRTARTMHRLTLLAMALATMLQLSAARAAGDAVAGKAVFSRCASCHQVGPSARGAFGPQLNGIVGRRAAATGDFKYSPALKASGIVWTEDALRAFVKAPRRAVPGTSMRFFGLGDDQKITDLLAYLQSFR